MIRKSFYLIFIFIRFFDMKPERNTSDRGSQLQPFNAHPPKLTMCVDTYTKRLQWVLHRFLERMKLLVDLGRSRLVCCSKESPNNRFG